MTDEAKSEGKEMPDAERKDTWAHDQRKRSYYYDDASGYETFDPALDEEETESAEEEVAEKGDELT